MISKLIFHLNKKNVFPSWDIYIFYDHFFWICNFPKNIEIHPTSLSIFEAGTKMIKKVTIDFPKNLLPLNISYYSQKFDFWISNSLIADETFTWYLTL